MSRVTIRHMLACASAGALLALAGPASAAQYSGQAPAKHVMKSNQGQYGSGYHPNYRPYTSGAGSSGSMTGEYAGEHGPGGRCWDSSPGNTIAGHPYGYWGPCKKK